MTALLLSPNTLTMSSREIAELCDKEHGHVMRDIRSMLIELYGEDGQSRFGSSYTNAQNRQMPEYTLPKDLTITLVAGYNVKLRKRIIDRWMELEAGPAKPVLPQNYVEALKALVSAEEARLSLVAQNAVLIPKAVAHDVIAESFGAVCRRIAAKNIQVPPQVLNRWLMENGWTYGHRGSDDILAYQSKIAAGYLVHKVTNIPRSDGTVSSRTTVHVTPKGMLALAALLKKELTH